MSFFKGNYYTPKEASEKLGVHWQTLKNWEKNGKIKCVRSPGGKRYYDIQDFIEKTEKNLKNDKKEEKNKKELNIRKKICYCRVSSYSQKIELKNQIEKLSKEKE